MAAAICIMPGGKNRFVRAFLRRTFEIVMSAVLRPRCAGRWSGFAGRRYSERRKLSRPCGCAARDVEPAGGRPTASPSVAVRARPAMSRRSQWVPGPAASQRLQWPRDRRRVDGRSASLACDEPSGRSDRLRRSDDRIRRAACNGVGERSGRPVATASSPCRIQGLFCTLFDFVASAVDLHKGFSTPLRRFSTSSFFHRKKRPGDKVLPRDDLATKLKNLQNRCEKLQGHEVLPSKVGRAQGCRSARRLALLPQASRRPFHQRAAAEAIARPGATPPTFLCV